jgi:hypothetical protein
MKLKIFLILICNILLVSCLKKEDIRQKSDKIEHEILNKTIRQLKKEKKLKFLGFGESGNVRLSMLSLSFSTDKSYEINNGRKMIIYCAETFLKNINSNEQMRPYLQNYPFNSKNIEIFLLLNIKTKIPNKQELESIVLSHGYIRYEISDEQDNLKTIHKETYEEALKIVQSENEKK